MASDLASGGSFRLASVSFHSAPVILWVLPYFLVHQDVLGLACTFPASALAWAVSPGCLQWRRVFRNRDLLTRCAHCSWSVSALWPSRWSELKRKSVWVCVCVPVFCCCICTSLFQQCETWLSLSFVDELVHESPLHVTGPRCCCHPWPVWLRSSPTLGSSSPRRNTSVTAALWTSSPSLLGWPVSPRGCPLCSLRSLLLSSSLSPPHPGPPRLPTPCRCFPCSAHLMASGRNGSGGKGAGKGHFLTFPRKGIS